ncbi:MAG: DUF5592 family protein [Clostridium sp.]|uniref:DUF5592 family protein n=1 Tax=Clostridium TaxID=1485 RepID=UPI000C06966A|nr:MULTISPECIES: DUF5592 family protein [Clostridium]MDB2104957.1 DUF5592 family protein [Clostridium paraputrificum]MDU1034197.1 DUF5592 family protein [Clostridium sp.]MDU1077198.1 DUF5592 family protein [Clostridium sp.]MDU1126935.1 DUF5592 family protein [Clostridium sp.]MDU2108862.1 DUF5592 family protein [Clostridium sp.]
MKFMIPEELDVKMGTKFPINFMDFLIIILSFILSILLRIMVYEGLQILFIIFVVSTTTILVLNSPDNKGKKIYQSIYLVFKRDDRTFHRIDVKD